MATKYVLKAEKGKGWRIWNRTHGRYWGGIYSKQPDELLKELEGQRRHEVLDKLMKQYQ